MNTQRTSKMLRKYGVFAFTLYVLSLHNVFGSAELGDGVVSLENFENILDESGLLPLERDGKEMSTDGTNHNMTQTTIPNNASIDEAFLTPDGIDPNDPEEIARIKYLKENMDVFQHILDINEHVNKTDLTEGDIKEQVFRNAGGGRPWPKTNTGTHRGLVRIPYTIASQYSNEQRKTILSAMDAYKKYTCIRFIPRTSQRAYIHVLDSRGCWAYVGTTGAPKQTVSLGIPGCVSKGVALHELMHTLGFQHEQSRSDRDEYVRVIGENIEGGWNSNYNKIESTRNLVIYDYGSVMHYGKGAFAKKSYFPAMVVYPERDPTPSFGQRQRLSPYDIEEINYLYNCGAGTFSRCGRDYNNVRSGTLTSPSHPNAYPKEAHCTWKITVARGSYVEVTFTNVNIEESPLCQKDGILIHNGRNAAAPILQRICGRKSSVVVTSTVHEIFIIFSSDVSPNTLTGFRASFKQVASAGSSKPALKVTPPTLSPIQNVINSFSCDFNNNLCGMTQDTNDATDFIPNRGNTPTSRTGPDRDHSGNGQYLFLESSQPAKVGDTARIRTPWFKRTDEFCIQFSYHMYGQFMGGLRVYAFEKRTSNNIGTPVRLWEKLDDQGNQWKDATVTYKPRKNVQFVQFFVEGFIYFYLSDLAIDDLSIRSTSCSAPTVHPQTTSTAIPTTTPLVGGVRRSFRCNFENGFCGFIQSRSDAHDWVRKQGRTPTIGTGPRNDHTSGRGTYAFVESSNRNRGDIAILETPALSPSAHCLELWYNMNGRTMGSLTIIQEVDGARSTLKQIDGHKGEEWVKLTSNVSPGRQNARYIKILIEATLGPGVYSDIAIDDVVITDRQCTQVATVAPSSLPNRFVCDFERNMCGLKQPLDDNFDWTRRQGATPSRGTGPSSDNTLKTSSGYYIFTESSTPQRQGDLAKLVTPKLRPGTYCVRFSYHMFGSSVGNIEVMSSEAPAEIPITEWREDNNQGQQWRAASFDFTSSSKGGALEFIFLGQLGTGFSSDMALDDIRIESGTCSGVTTLRPPTTQSPTTTSVPIVTGPLSPTFSCNFESSSLCGMIQAQNDNFDWTRHQGATRSRNTGPSGDHTVNLSGRGNYIYIEGSLPNRPQQAAAIYTPSLSAESRQVCLVYYYHMFGTAVGRLDVVAEYFTSSNQKTTRALSSKSGNQANRWILNQMTIDVDPRYNGGYMKIKFQARIGTTSSSDIALDDICVAAGPCGQSSQCSRDGVLVSTTNAPATTTRNIATTQPPTTTTTTTNAPTVVVLLSAFDCNFESSSMCGMNQETTDDFDWTRHQGATRSRNTGPSRDHTVTMNGRGNYVYIEGSLPNRPGQSSMISTPLLAANSRKMCMVFYYHMFGNAVGRLSVIADFISRSNQRSTKTLTQKNGDKGDRWNRNLLEIDVDPSYMGGSMKIKFQATVGSTSSSDIALDDVCISAGACGFSQCHIDGYLMSSTTRPETTRQTTPRSTTTPQPSTTTAERTTAIRGPSTTVRPAPAPNAQPAWAGMPLCTFDTPRSSSSRIPSSVIPGDSTNDLGAYVYSTVQRTSALCGFIQFAQYDNFDWTRKTGGTATGNTGPTSDRTSSSGYYMYIEASGKKENDVAFFQTYFMLASDYCVDFYYHMYGQNMGRMVLKTVQTLNDGRRRRPTIHTLSGNRGNAWRNIKVDFTPVDNATNVAFRLEGKVGSSSKSDAAFDDFSIMPGRCDACQNPSHRYTVNGRVQQFATGCIHTGLFYVRCCSSSQPKAVYRRVRNCNGNMFSAVRLNWYCQNL